MICDFGFRIAELELGCIGVIGAKALGDKG